MDQEQEVKILGVNPFPNLYLYQHAKPSDCFCLKFESGILIYCRILKPIITIMDDSNEC